jgi:signal recognition particle subunit SEC65
MIDFEKEEFLARLDIRIATITSALAYHEKYLQMDLPRKEYKEAERVINNMNKRFNEYVKEMDEKIREHFDKLKEKIANENCDNE